MENTQQASYWNNLAQKMFSEKQYEKNLEAALKAVEFAPSNAELWNNLSIAYASTSNFEKCIEAEKKANELEKLNYKYWHNLGSFYFLLKRDYTEAIKYLKGAISLNPNFAFTWNLLGESYNKLGNYNEAIISNQRALNLEPDNIKYSCSLGLSYLLADDCNGQAKL